MARKHALDDAEVSDVKKKGKFSKQTPLNDHRKVKPAVAKPLPASNIEDPSHAVSDSETNLEADAQGKSKSRSVPLHQSKSPTKTSKVSPQGSETVPPATLPQNSKAGPPGETKHKSTEQEEAAAILPTHLASLVSKYSFATMSIKNHSKINSKVTTMIRHMSRFDFMDKDVKPGIVVLDAKSSDANKMITVVEIAKKNIFENNRSGKWYQYNRVSSEMIEIPRKGAKKQSKASKQIQTSGDGNEMDIEPVSTEHDGEGTPNPRDMKVRAIPTLIIYMARVPIPELKAEFGEQSNEKDIVKWWEPLARAPA